MSTATKESGQLDFSAIRWSDNLRPVDPETERQAIAAFVQGQRVTTARINRRISRADVADLTPTAMFILSAYASGQTISQLAKLGFRRPDLARVMTWANAMHKLSGPALREIGLAAGSPEAIVEAIVDHAGGKAVAS